MFECHVQYFNHDVKVSPFKCYNSCFCDALTFMLNFDHAITKKWFIEESYHLTYWNVTLIKYMFTRVTHL